MFAKGYGAYHLSMTTMHPDCIDPETGDGSAVSPVLLPLANLFCDPRSGLADIVPLGLLLESSRFPHYLPGAVFEGFGPFAFLAGLLTCAQFALWHEQSLRRGIRRPSSANTKLQWSIIRGSQWPRALERIWPGGSA